MIDVEFGTLSEPLSSRTWDRAEIRRQIALRVGRFEARGLAPDDRVILAFGNCLEFFAELMAIWRLGACAIPVDARLTPFEMGNLARAAEARFSVVDDSADGEIIAALLGAATEAICTREEGRQSAGKPGLRLDADALMLFTSGSTGDPKGVVHTHRSLRARWSSLRHQLPTAAFARTLCMLPTHFGHGLICNALFPWLSGCDLHITPPFRTDLLARLGRLIDDAGITFLSSVPPVWKLALKLAASPTRGTLQRVHVGSAPLSARAWDDIRRWTGIRQVCNAYGITETGSWVAGLADADADAEDGLIGTGWGAVIAVLGTGDTAMRPAPELLCAAGESGYVWLNTPALMKGYFRRDDLTAKAVVDGWFMTGDIGVLDERGRLYLRGRERDEINKGGMKIYPSDIDAVVERFAGARDVCAFAIDDAIYGQVVGMAVVLADSGPEEIRALHEWMKRHLADYKMPSRWWAIESIPRTSRGKLNRDTVKASCSSLPALDLPGILAGARQP